jgi:hypothetical protein
MRSIVALADPYGFARHFETNLFGATLGRVAMTRTR